MYQKLYLAIHICYNEQDILVTIQIAFRHSELWTTPSAAYMRQWFESTLIQIMPIIRRQAII